MEYFECAKITNILACFPQNSCFLPRDNHSELALNNAMEQGLNLPAFTLNRNKNNTGEEGVWKVLAHLWIRWSENCRGCRLAKGGRVPAKSLVGWFICNGKSGESEAWFLLGIQRLPDKTIGHGLDNPWFASPWIVVLLCMVWILSIYLFIHLYIQFIPCLSILKEEAQGGFCKKFMHKSN